MISTEIFLVKGISDDSAELPCEVLFKELLDVHHRGIIFGAEPFTPLATLCPTDVAWVSSRCLTTSAIVLPKTIFEEGLRQTDLKESAVGTYRQSFRRCQQSPGVDATEQRYLLLPEIGASTTRAEISVTFVERFTFELFALRQCLDALDVVFEGVFALGSGFEA